MKLARMDQKALVFELRKQERDILVHTLGLYPVVPPAHHKITNQPAQEHTVEWQALLDEALAGQRAANKHRVQSWLAAPGRFKALERGCELTVMREDSDWLLQVVNDIRVGTWLLLGSPEIPPVPEKLGAEVLRHWVAMEVCGFVQMALLHGFGSATTS